MRLAAIVLIAALSLPAFGQRRFVVVDIETGVPISDVNVVSSTHQADTTNWQGLIDIPDTCRTVNVTELRDTVFLISKLLNLKEVVVFGKGKGNDELTERLKKQMRIDKTEKEWAAADPSAGFNVLGLLSKLFSRRKESKKEKLRRILEDY